MQVWFAMAALLASLAVAEPAFATPGLSVPPGDASDTERGPAVPRGRRSSEGWNCTPNGCSSAPASSSRSAALGFAITTLMAAGISRRRPPATA